MTKKQDYYLKDALQLFAGFIMQSQADLDSDEIKNPKLLEGILIELLDKIEEMKGIICEYRKENIIVMAYIPSVFDKEKIDYKKIIKDYLEGRVEPTAMPYMKTMNLVTEEADSKQIIDGKNFIKDYLEDMLDSAAKSSLKAMYLVTEKADSKQINDELYKLYWEINILGINIFAYKSLYVTNHEENLVYSFKLARRYAIKALSSMQKADLLAASEKFNKATQEIYEYYYSLKINMEECLDEYNDSYQDSEKYFREECACDEIQEFIELAEAAIDSMDSDSLNKVAAGCVSAAFNIREFLRVEPDEDMSEIPKLMPLAWQLETMENITDLFPRYQRASHKKEQDERNEEREPETSRKLKEILRDVISKVEEAYESMDSDYLDMISDELIELERLITRFTIVVKAEEEIVGHIGNEGYAFLKSLKKFGRMMKSHNKAFIKKKFIKAQEAIENYLNEQGEDYEDDENSMKSAKR